MTYTCKACRHLGKCRAIHFKVLFSFELSVQFSDHAAVTSFDPKTTFVLHICCLGHALALAARLWLHTTETQVNFMWNLALQLVIWKLLRTVAFKGCHLWFLTAFVVKLEHELLKSHLLLCILKPLDNLVLYPVVMSLHGFCEQIRRNRIWIIRIL